MKFLGLKIKVNNDFFKDKFNFCTIKDIDKIINTIHDKHFKLDRNSYNKGENLPEIYNYTLDYLRWIEAGYSLEHIYKCWRKLINKNFDNKWYSYEGVVYFLLMHGDPINKLNIIFKLIEKEKNWQEKIHCVTYLHYISLLIFEKKYEKATELLKDYNKRHGDNLIANLLPVAWFAQKNGIESEIIQTSAKIWEHILLVEKNNDFGRYIKNKTIALVGNGPQEAGKKLGNLINNYDIVIRMNKFSTSIDYQADYGSKVNVWATCLFDIQEILKNKEIDFVCPFVNWYGELADERTIKFLSELIENDKKILLYSPQKRKEMYQKYKLGTPSGGFHMIYYLSTYISNFSMENCYGFSYKDSKIHKEWVHYDQEKIAVIKNRIDHDLDKEKKIINKILNNKRH